MRNKSGSSTLEFIFCAPLLVIVMFVAQELNERIEQRVTSAIAAGNAAWLAVPSTTSHGMQGGLQDLAKADVLGVKAGANPSILKVQGDSVLSNSDVVMTYSNTKRRADSYNLRIVRTQDSSSTKNAILRSQVEIGTSKNDQIAAKLFGVASNASQFLQRLTNPKSNWLPTTFPAMDVEEQRLSWTITQSGSSNAAINAIETLAKSMGQNSGTHFVDTSAAKSRILAHHSTFLRRDPAYHPNGYYNQALMGLAIGSGNFADYNSECFMKFLPDKSKCGEDNGFVDYIFRVYGLVVLGKTALDSATIACIASTLGVGTGACIAPKLSMIAVEKGIDIVIQEAMDAAKNKLISVVKDKIKQLTDSIATSIGGNGILDLDDTFLSNITDSINRESDAAAGGYLSETP